ncbi:MAG: hypothetical protein KZQ90_10950 [Candidatus Thiodiazotropha sp. (ex Codakia rugifera)]|nr:hypothetical protein [Candidatus Thiodiazotropha sp. (ex Codakia rugifera)]
MKKLNITLVLGMMLVIPGWVTAQTPLTSPGPIPFETFDVDGNGSISRQEFETVHAQRRSARINQGGPMRGLATSPKFQYFDSNDDGQLSQKELLSGQHNRMMMNRSGKRGGMGLGRNMPTFGDFDLNQDGVLIQEELDQARAKRIAERASQGYMMRNLGNAPTFNAIDRDRDGQVTPDEFTAAQAAHRRQRNR